MSLFHSFLLGLVQGLTEFLPISSSGHLILLREVLGINTETGLAFDAVLQLGTILAVFLFFRRDVGQLIQSALRYVGGKGKMVAQEDKTLLITLLIGTIPALIFGLLLERVMATAFRDAFLVALMLIIGSFLFIIAERSASQTSTAPTIKQGWYIGWFQALALIPGMSRSGATLSGGLLLGLTREAAARFSFLLSLPIISGSGIKKLVEVLQAGSLDTSLASLSLGFLTAFVVGFGCIHFLLAYLKNHTLYIFVWYRLALAALVLVAILR